ncbi:MAG TPA: hypothetical protein VLH56_03170 [Dissulfurispiraceae bacterium]|nr:hypothetical protein [Dissulfurispiraceae bacterium]
MAELRNYKAIAADVAEGMVSVNPIFLKHFQGDEVVKLFKAIDRRLMEVRSEPFPYGKADPIRRRNIRIQRLHSAMVIIRNHARDKKIVIY